MRGASEKHSGRRHLIANTAAVAAFAQAAAVAGIDLPRLRRAVHLTVVDADFGRYIVTGGVEAHLVQLYPQPRCDCPDAKLRGAICKHRLAVALHHLRHGAAT